MLNVTRASLYKMFRDKIFWISLACTVCWAGFVIAMQVLTLEMRGFSDPSEVAGRCWNTFIGLHAIELPLIISASLLFSAEFKDRSWKLLIAKGISKISFFISKLICVLVLALCLTLVAIVSGFLFIVMVYHPVVDGAYLLKMLQFFLAQFIANAAIAGFIYACLYVTKNGEVTVGINMFMMVMGFALLNKFQSVFGLGEFLTDAWIYSMPAFAEFEYPIEWGWICLWAVIYIVGFGILANLLTFRRDVE